MEPNHSGTAAVPPTILAVDDDEMILELLQAILRTAGYQVLPASGARDAIRVFESAHNPIQLLITDVVMPDLTGPVLATRLRRHQPDLKVLFISGFHDTELVQRFVVEQGFALLPKPFTGEGLLRTVRNSLSPG